LGRGPRAGCKKVPDRRKKGRRYSLRNSQKKNKFHPRRQGKKRRNPQGLWGGKEKRLGSTRGRNLPGETHRLKSLGRLKKEGNSETISLYDEGLLCTIGQKGKPSAVKKKSWGPTAKSYLPSEKPTKKLSPLKIAGEEVARAQSRQQGETKGGIGGSLEEGGGIHPQKKRPT